LLKEKMMKKGFTLIELLVVVAILVILAAIIVPCMQDRNLMKEPLCVDLVINDIEWRGDVDYGSFYAYTDQGSYRIQAKETSKNNEKSEAIANMIKMKAPGDKHTVLIANPKYNSKPTIVGYVRFIAPVSNQPEKE